MTSTLTEPDARTQHHPHPDEDEIRALLNDGHRDAEIGRQLDIDPRAVAHIRTVADVAPTYRNTRSRRPHPKEQMIGELLAEGHTNTEIRRRTGADMQTIARRRAEGGFGPPSIRIRKPRPHPKESQIRALLRQGLSSDAIARELQVDRAAVRGIRKKTGIPNVPRQPLTLEQKWAERTRPVEGGHLEWTGERGKKSGTPVMRYSDKSHSPAGIAFRKRTGRAPIGQVYAECGFKHCVAPGHVDDQPGRQRAREQLRYLIGGTERNPLCRRRHDQAEHGRYKADGTAYCEACKREQRSARRAAA